MSSKQAGTGGRPSVGAQTVMELAAQLEARRSNVDLVVQEICDRFDEIMGLNIDIGWGNGLYVTVEWMTPDEQRHHFDGETLAGALRGALRRMEETIR